ncbi:uncharacterized protein, partial [Drosophila virilis]|uniref:uncharacterized protein n=1 Tax=Drosophila virilis TaxID=7244 RepID=UPI0038B408E6
YFTGGLLQYDTADGPTTHKVSAGVPQGSVLGPVLWNIMYDGILRLELPIYTSIIGFADDVALVVVGKELKDVEESCNHSIDRLLSGRGCFRSYLKRFGHDNTDECSWCGRGIIEDANHVIFECGRFATNRQELEDIMSRPITVDNLVTSMIETAQKWDAASTFAAEVMRELRRVERSRRRSADI